MNTRLISFQSQQEWHQNNISGFCFIVVLLLTLHIYLPSTKQAFTFSKLSIESLEKGYEICPKLTIKTPERRQWRCSGVIIANFEHISQFFIVFWTNKCLLGKNNVVLGYFVGTLRSLAKKTYSIAVLSIFNTESFSSVLADFTRILRTSFVTIKYSRISCFDNTEQAHTSWFPETKKKIIIDLKRWTRYINRKEPSYVP